jgi:membrane associated rhomboid family serine protease
MIPIRTEMVARRTPVANYALIAANVLAFLVVDWIGGAQLADFKYRTLILHAGWPSLHQFFTYQFMHDGLGHLAGNMLFLWVFGNCVNAKFGDIGYVLFYLAGGVFAGWTFSVGNEAPLLGASGAIAAVTTAYLVLFPRSRVTVIYFFFFIGFFEIPAVILIGLKIVVWDNIIAPSIGGAGNVAVSAHMGGYLFGFCGAMMMLLLRALPRDHFDLLSLVDRWNRRRVFKSAMDSPEAQMQATYGSVARTQPLSADEQRAESARFDQIGDLRSRIADLLDSGDISGAAELYGQLIAIDPGQCLSARHQLLVARECYAQQKFPQAAAAFERYLSCYPDGFETEEIRLLLGIIYARDLHQFAEAEKHLERTLERIAEGDRRTLCRDWLESVRASLGKPATDA